MRSTRVLWVASIVALASAGMVASDAPAGAADPVQRCTRPEADARAGTVVFRPGLNARATKQKITTEVALANCTPPAATGGAGVLSATFKPPAAQTCALINRAHALPGNAKVTWKNGTTSALKITLTLSGASRSATFKGKVTAGSLRGHRVAGTYRYVPFASHHGTTVAQACANSVAPNEQNRNSIVQMKLFRARPFVID